MHMVTHLPLFTLIMSYVSCVYAGVAAVSQKKNGFQATVIHIQKITMGKHYCY